MLLFKNGKFHVSGVSFAIPDGFYLETEADEIWSNGFQLYAPDRRYTVELRAEESEMTTGEELESILREGEYEILLPVGPVEVNGLAGHHAVYLSSGYGFYEIRLDLGEAGAFVLLVCTGERERIEAIKESPELRGLIQEIGKSNLNR